MNAFRPSGFFVSRTPSLSLEEYAAWTSGAAAANTLDEHLGRVIRLYRESAFVRESVRLASPDLCGTIGEMLAAGRMDEKPLRALYRYAMRMFFRATPFGLFATTTCGTIGERSHLGLAGRERFVRKSRPAMEWLTRIADDVRDEHPGAPALRYRVNDTLFRADETRHHYLEERPGDSSESAHVLVTVESTPHLDAVLAAAAGRATHAALVETLCAFDRELEESDAAAYVTDLIHHRVLLPEYAPALTAGDALGRMIESLGDGEELRPLRESLRAVHTALERIDRGEEAGIDLPPIQVDTTRGGSRPVLSRSVTDEILHGVELLHLTTSYNPDQPLEAFKREFTRYYGEKQVPLLQAINEEFGLVFFGKPDLSAGLLPSLPFPQHAADTITVSRRDMWLNDRLNAPEQAGRYELEVTEDELRAVADSRTKPLPDTFAALVRIDAADVDALDRGDYRFWMRMGPGPSGVRLLARYAHLDPALEQSLREHVDAEERLDRDAIFADIVHMPAARWIGNILQRPPIRRYEIPCLGTASVPRERQIDPRELLLSVEGNELVLRRASDDRRVVPRLSTAHVYYARGNVDLYRFLAALENQGSSGAATWGWPSHDRRPFLPRVRCGRVVLSRAAWRVAPDELRALHDSDFARMHVNVDAWRRERGMPRLVAVVEGDNELVIDFDDPLSASGLVQYLSSRGTMAVVELFPGEQTPFRSPEGRLLSELIIPFERGAPTRTRPEWRWSPSVIRRPGSDWLQLRLAVPQGLVDYMLTRNISGLVERERAAGADRWAFIVSDHPESFLRIRLHYGSAGVRSSAVEWLNERLDYDATIFGPELRYEIETYEPETDRYGGARGLELAERLFTADSDLALEAADFLRQGADASERWIFALAATNALADDLAFTHQEKLEILARQRTRFWNEFAVTDDAGFRRAAAALYRRNKARIEAAVSGELPERWADALSRRSARIAPIARDLQRAHGEAAITKRPLRLAESYIHMGLNRLLRTSARAQEVALYDFLPRALESLAMRRRSRA